MPTPQEARNGQFLWPLALTLMQSAGEMALVEQGVYYHNEVGIEGTAKLDPFLNTLGGRSARNLFPGAPCFGQVFLSNGPTINLTMPRGDTDAGGRIWNPRLQEWPLDLDRHLAGGAEGGPGHGRHHAHPALPAGRRQGVQDRHQPGPRAAEGDLRPRRRHAGARGGQPRHQQRLLAAARHAVRRPQQPTPVQHAEAGRRHALLHQLRRRHAHARQGPLERAHAARWAVSCSTPSSGSAP